MANAIKEATKTLHENLELLPFNQKMFRGEQTDSERTAYLLSNLEIFELLDPYVPEDFRRASLIENDIKTLDKPLEECPNTTHGYCTYLEAVCDDLRPHIYLNYMGFMFGGQIMKKRYPKASSMYEFDDIDDKRNYIRDKIVEDYNSPHWRSFVFEVKHGFKWHIGIAQELGQKYNVG
jgi:hypothetical protein